MPRSKSTVLWRNRVIELALREFSGACHCLEVGERMEEAYNQVCLSLKDNTNNGKSPINTKKHSKFKDNQVSLSLWRITHLLLTYLSRPNSISNHWSVRHAINVGGVEAPRGFLIGWINQSARLSLHRHSGDLMHRPVSEPTIHALNRALLHPSLSEHFWGAN